MNGANPSPILVWDRQALSSSTSKHHVSHLAAAFLCECCAQQAVMSATRVFMVCLQRGGRHEAGGDAAAGRTAPAASSNRPAATSSSTKLRTFYTVHSLSLSLYVLPIRRGLLIRLRQLNAADGNLSWHPSCPPLWGRGLQSPCSVRFTTLAVKERQTVICMPPRAADGLRQLPPTSAAAAGRVAMNHRQCIHEDASSSPGPLLRMVFAPPLLCP